MSYKKKDPPIKVELTVDMFNSMLEALEKNIKSTDQKISTNAEKMREKLLKYSVPREDVDKNIIIDVRFFPNETSNIILYLLNILDIEISTDYYSVLLKMRDNFKNSEYMDS